MKTKVKIIVPNNEDIDIIQVPTTHWKLNLSGQLDHSGECLLISHL
jgi:hypothetical protein